METLYNPISLFNVAEKFDSLPEIVLILVFRLKNPV